MPDLPTAVPTAQIDDPSEGPLSSQQCGRCRRTFEMESTTEPGTIPEMWLCANCRVALLGRPTAVTKPRV